MVDVHTGGDKAAPPLEPTLAHPFESSSQQLSMPGAAGDGGHAAVAHKSSEMVSSGNLPGVELIADGGKHGKASGKSEAANYSAQQLESGAAGVENLLKHNAPAEDMAKAVNQSLDQGVPLSKLVDQINKDMPYPAGINFRHAVLETNASGKQELVMGMGPFAGPQFKVDGPHVTVDHPQK